VDGGGRPGDRSNSRCGSLRDRLYAFGFDAYRLVPALRASPPATGEISGVTGKLHLDGSNRIRRDLDWAQIRNGVPNLL
jgi:outer membrane PBP1 activator LpoA protein